MLRRLEMVGVAPEAVRAVVLTHEHDDHVKGSRVFCDDLGIPLYASALTTEYLYKKGKLPREVMQFEPGDVFQIGGFEISPFAVQHDAIDPVGFVFRRGASRIGIATDVGELNTLCMKRLANCSALILESNYDREMLLNSDRRLHLKRRINGRNGHLDNRDAAAALPALLGEATRLLLLVHVSSECNTYSLVHEIAARTIRDLRRDDIQFAVVEQARGEARVSRRRCQKRPAKENQEEFLEIF